MALSGTIYGSFSAKATNIARPYITWSASQNTTNNTSSVTATLYFVRYDGYRSWNNTAQSMTITINGTGTSGSYAFDMPGNGVVDTVFSATTSVTHSSDGTKTINISASGNTGLSSIGTFSVSGSVTLDTIPRASGFTAFTLSNSVLNKDTAVTVNYTLDRKSTSFSQDMTLKLGSKTIKSWNTTSTGALTQALSTAEVNTIITSTTSATSGTLTLVMQTKSGTSNIGSSASRTANFTLNSAIKPTATGLTVSISGSGRDKTISKYVQNVTKPTASFTAASGYGATVTSNIIIIKRQSDSGNSQTITGTSGTVANAVSLSGVYSVTATTTDSRGMTATASTTFTVDAYTQPSITKFTTSRSTPTTTVSNAITLTWSLGASNPTNVTVVGVNNVGTSATLYTLVGNTAGSLNTTRSYTSQSDASSYTYTITVTDSFGYTSTAKSTVGTTFVEMTLAKGYGIGVAKVWERGALDVGGDAYATRFIGRLGSERIPASSDLNNYTTEGLYYCPMNIDVATLLNRPPTSSAFSLLVERTAGVKQTFTTYLTSGWVTWQRTQYTTTWSKWRRVANDYPLAFHATGGGQTLSPNTWARATWSDKPTNPEGRLDSNNVWTVPDEGWFKLEYSVMINQSINTFYYCELWGNANEPTVVLDARCTNNGWNYLHGSAIAYLKPDLGYEFVIKQVDNTYTRYVDKHRMSVHRIG